MSTKHAVIEFELRFMPARRRERSRKAVADRLRRRSHTPPQPKPFENYARPAWWEPMASAARERAWQGIDPTPTERMFFGTRTKAETLKMMSALDRLYAQVYSPMLDLFDRPSPLWSMIEKTADFKGDIK